MAVLKSGELSFNFQYTGFQHGWVQYEFYFLWKDEPLVKDNMLKRGGAYWDSRHENAFMANEDTRDGFLPFIRKILDTDIADYWEPIEPDIVVAIYPDQFFPFLKSHLTLVYESDEVKAAAEARKKLKEEKKKLPDDFYTFIALVDAYNFKEADGYYGQGLSLNMIVERHDLEEFADVLEQEYLVFKNKFDVDGYVEN